MIRIKFTGIVETTAKMRDIAKKFPDRVGAALYYQTELIATKAKPETPIEFGPLRASIHADGPHQSGNQIYCEVVAGGGTTATYAIPVHEDPKPIHPEGGWKYIERPLMKSLPDVGPGVAAQLRDDIDVS